MKKLFILTLALIALGTSAFADTNKKVSYNGASHFTSNYTGAKEVSWSADANYEKVSFMENGIKKEVFYTHQGELIGSAKAFAFDKLPKAALQTITTKYTYPEFQLEDIIEFENAEGETSYFVSMDKSDMKLVLEITTYGQVSVFSKEIK
ncbi:MAG: hypothetical protein ACN4EP_07055 [Sediminibacterium sp.]|nr:hypothetical protein [uncultured Sediminibacterium sp.]